MPGEKDTMVYLPLGVGAVIPPWNFPLAILVGMTSAAIVTGNTVVLKPASDTPGIAWQFMALMDEVGLPPGVINFVTGDGGTVGDQIVRPKTRFVSPAQRKSVWASTPAAEVQPRARWLKRVVGDGRQDIVGRRGRPGRRSAGAAQARSARGQSAQRARAIVVDSSTTRSWRLIAGDTKLGTRATRVFGTTWGRSRRRAMNGNSGTLGRGSRGQAPARRRRVAGGRAGSCSPRCSTTWPPEREDRAGGDLRPVLATRARDYDDALRIANDTEFGLTGAVATRTRQAQKAREGFCRQSHLNQSARAPWWAAIRSVGST
jgi:1-pyrroline-5-carboxylate dehydrogenase